MQDFFSTLPYSRTLRQLGSIACAALLLVACGKGGGDGGGGTTPGAVSISGTAATGAPLANATITIKDRNGLQTTGTTGADGKYTTNVSALTAPFLLKVTAVGKPDLYSVGSQAGIVNLTPLTDMVVRNYYRVRGLDVASVFTTLTSASIIPTTDEVALLVNFVEGLVAQWLVANGVDPNGTDLITTAFDANGAGADAVLAASTVSDNGTTMTLTVTSGGTTQISTVSADAGTSLVTAATSVTNASGTANSVASTLVPSTANAITALVAVNAGMTQFKNLINTKGAALTDADLAPFLAPGAQDSGLNATQLAGSLASGLRGKTILTLDAYKVISYDDANKVMVVGVWFVQSTINGPAESKTTLVFKQVGSSWLMYGDQQLGRAGFDVESRIDNNGIAVSKKSVNVDVRVPQGLINLGAGVFVNCPTLLTLFNNTPLPNQGTSIETYHPTTNPADDFTVTSDVFFFTTPDLANYPPPGTVCTITMTPIGSAPVSYQVVTNATTTETVTMTPTPGGHALASVVGQTVTMNWTLPTTFQIVRIQSGGSAHNASNVTTLVSEVDHGPTATSGSVSIPATVAGQATNRASLGVNFNGPNGERINYLYHYQ